MVKTAPYDIFIGSMMWAIYMALPLMSLLFTNSELKLMILTLISPVAMSYLARSGRFWVAKGVIGIASVAAFIYGTVLIRASDNVRLSIQNPENKKAAAATSLSSIVLVFLLTMMSVSYFVEPMYNPSNFA